MGARIALGLATIAMTVMGASQEGWARKWSDDTGRYAVEAEFVRVQDGKAVLRRADGTIVAVPLRRLSRGDQDYVKDLVARRNAEQQAMPDRPNEGASEATTVGRRAIEAALAKRRDFSIPQRPVVSLTLGGQVGDADLVHLKGLPDLRKLRFEETRVSNAGLVHLKELPSLQTLELKGRATQQKLTGKGLADGEGEELTGKGLVHLKDLKSLRGLYLAWIQVNDADLEHVKALTSLKSLGLCGSGSLTDAGLEHLKELTGLEMLVLDGWLFCPGPVLTDAGVEHLKALTRLRVLVLRASITDAGLAHLKGLTNLKRLGLHGSRVTDAGLVHLKGFTNLEWLALNGSQVTDAGLEHLKGFTNLKCLTLNGSQVTDAGLEHLKGLTNLKHLRLYGTKVTEKGAASLQRVLPKAKIDYGPHPRP